MKIQRIQLFTYEIAYSHGYQRSGALIKIETEKGESGTGDLAPLKERSRETLSEAIAQFEEYESTLTSMNWDKNSFLDQIAELSLFPSLAFAIESALFSIFQPVFSYTLDTAALLMGNSVEQILRIADWRKAEGFKTAKLKIGNLTPDEATAVIRALNGRFRLRIDANSRWTFSDSVRFFSQFPEDLFEYIEDPIASFDDLKRFPFPIAIEEPLSRGISLESIETLPTLKALAYKPTVLGGYLVGKQLKDWADRRNISLVLSSSLESDVGHFHIAATAGRLGLISAIGIGTYQYLNQQIGEYKLHFQNGKCLIP